MFKTCNFWLIGDFSHPLDGSDVEVVFVVVKGRLRGPAAAAERSQRDPVAVVVGVVPGEVGRLRSQGRRRRKAGLVDGGRGKEEPPRLLLLLPLAKVERLVAEPGHHWVVSGVEAALGEEVWRRRRRRRGRTAWDWRFRFGRRG